MDSQEKQTTSQSMKSTTQKPIKPSEKDNFKAKAADLGINLNDENHIKTLWNKYCSKIKEFEIPLNTTDDSIDKDLTKADENVEQLSCGTEIIKDIFNSLKQEQSQESKSSNIDRIDWLQKQITNLDHIKGELELRLRNASTSAHNS